MSHRAVWPAEGITQAKDATKHRLGKSQHEGGLNIQMLLQQVLQEQQVRHRGCVCFLRTDLGENSAHF